MDPAKLNSVSSDATLINSILSVFSDNYEAVREVMKDCHNLEPGKIPKTKARIGMYDQLSIIGNATEKLGRGWEFRQTGFWSHAMNNVLCDAVRTAPTLSDSMDVMEQYGYLWSPLLYIEKFENKDFKTITFEVVELDGLPPTLETGRLVLRNLALIAIYRIMEETLGGAWGKARLLLRKNLDKAQLFKPFFSGVINQDQGRFGLQIARSLITLKNRHADPAVFRKANLYIQYHVNPADLDRTLEDRVTAYINSTHFHRPTIGEVAKSLGMSTRTLNRRLEHTGVSFRNLLDLALRKRAVAFLEQGQLSRGEIAERLGYKDQASFSRALRRWKIG